MKLIRTGLLLISVLLLLNSCGDDEPLPTIADYVAANNLTTLKSVSGLEYIIEEQGTTPNPTINSIVTIDYKGYLLNGEEFDSGEAVTFNLNGLIRGWQEGLQYIGTGGKIVLLIPSELAYGSTGTRSGSIPPNTDIGFDITLIGHR